MMLKLSIEALSDVGVLIVTSLAGWRVSSLMHHIEHHARPVM